MRRVLVCLWIVAVGVGSGALVASAGPAESTSATVGYTVLVEPGATAAPATAPAGPEDPAGLDVGPLQESCAGRLATVDLTTGAVAPLPEPPSPEACAGDLAFAPDGTLYGLVLGSDLGGSDRFPELVRFDTTTGQATVVGRIGDFSAQAGFGLPVPPGGLTFDANGRLFVEAVGDTGLPSPDPGCLGDDLVAFCLYQVDPTQPSAATLVGVTRSGVNLDFLVSGMSASCTAAYSSVVDVEGGPLIDDLVALDTESATVADLGEPRDDRLIIGQAFDATGTLWGLEVERVGGSTEGFELVTLDPAGGTPVDTAVAGLDVDPDASFVGALAIEPIGCTPAPLVLVPTFTG